MNASSLSVGLVMLHPMAKAVAITEQCPMEIGLNILGGKWKLKILWQISKGAVRFNELQRRLRPFTNIDRKPLRHVTFFQKIKCRGQNSFVFCPRTFRLDNHVRKCIGHSPNKIPLALHVRL
ncbi:winged helix-turn-helix transcriptional regulator [Acutalibacter sp. JLR.KK004]|uniref:winged helix-turn-helix transcriptional regulator n=1 Tax=Acutalibacter sp. JLR.KK004 TaxID=3112622 RepID=UPI002FF384C0